MKLNSAALSCKVPGSIPKSREGDRGEGHKGKTGRERGGVEGEKQGLEEKEGKREGRGGEGGRNNLQCLIRKTYCFYIYVAHKMRKEMASRRNRVTVQTTGETHSPTPEWRS